MIKIKKTLTFSFLFILLLSAILMTWLYSQVESALPQLEGNATIMGLENSVIIERDKNGVPTLKAKNRLDLAVATGFIHAQERFFQMDLLRRNSAGELSSLFGAIAVDYDKSVRLHRFRDRAIKIVNALPIEQANLLKAYTSGVNEGLRSLRAVPFEYLLLRQTPVAWQEEDSILTVLSMYLELQSKDGRRERSLGLIQSALGDSAFAFLNPKGSRWDAAIDNSQYSPSPLPLDNWLAGLTKSVNSPISKIAKTDYDSEEFPGSNNWAVGGAISKTGSAIVANDMHLGIRVPNTWFRASFEYTSANNSSVKVTGLTLPGTPAMTTGSNGNIAWGFTNSNGDWNDVIILQTNDDASQYLTPKGYKPFTQHRQIIAVKGEDPVEVIVKETIWGPVIGKNSQDQLLAYRWVAHDKQAVNFFAMQLEQANNIKQAFSIASHSGIPAQNMMVADNAGSIGWTIMGAIPQKSAEFGEIPTSWADGKNQWQGYLTEAEYPRIENPQHHRLWTANSRVVGSEMLEKLGNGGYAIGARSQQIRDKLFEQESFDEKALLAIALDDRAIFLQRWQQFILSQVLVDKAISNKPLWQQAKTFLTEHEVSENEASDKTLTASVGSVAYRIVRNFRINLRNDTFRIFNEKLTDMDQSYNFRSIQHQLETPLWQLINQQPDHFLQKSQGTWQAVFQQAMTKTLADMTENQPLEKATWGQQNTTNIRHPLTNGVPFLARWLNMPAMQLAGDSYMPRVQGKAFGASERMIVSPGHEESGILHMPTSQAGHPWSPYFGAGHQDWEQGIASPFLPGKTKYTLTLLNY